MCFYNRCSYAFFAFFYIIAEFDKSFLTLLPYIKMLRKLLILICFHFNVKAKMLNLAFVAVHSGEHCGPCASVFFSKLWHFENLGILKLSAIYLENYLS